MQMPKKFIISTMLLFAFANSTYAQFGFSHEIGAIVGPVAFQSDYGQRYDFATNAGYGWYGNGDLIVNSIDWAAKAENLISLTPKQTVNRTLVQPQGNTMGLILLASLIVLPGVVIVAGVSAWLIRRKQG